MDKDEFVVEQIELMFELILILVLLNVLHFDFINEVNLVLIDSIDEVNDSNLYEYYHHLLLRLSVKLCVVQIVMLESFRISY
jgi:hypothetical protein